jgi:collagenase-like PrtC family protease
VRTLVRVLAQAETASEEVLVAEGMVSAQDARTLHAEMMRYADDETTIVTWPRIVQAWGRLPASDAVTPG